MENNIQAIIFDFDGTLYDKKHFAIRLIFNDLQNIFLIRAERAARRQMQGIDCINAENFYMIFFEKMSMELNNKKYSAEFCKKWYFEKYLPSFIKILKKHYSAHKDVTEIFTTLKAKNIKTAVLSDYPCVAQRMNAIGIDIQSISPEMPLLSSEDFGALKPCPRPFLAIAEMLQTAPKNTLVVGDRADTDGAGAEKAGMQFLKVEKDLNSVCKNF
ncbi:MAG: HAD family hydrolase [Prevotellaceae bacterium]|jgi:HAD superfamily hydrolase (TIGR01549 family)|nr:HAD family hydrolase [Prevotellaceae bacterium]